MSEWISVKDRLPEKIHPVLGVNSNGNRFICTFQCMTGDIHRYCFDEQMQQRDPTHWMPLPAPLKEGG